MEKTDGERKKKVTGKGQMKNRIQVDDAVGGGE